MADPYSQALSIGAPFANLGRQMFQGQAMYEQGRMKAEEAAAKNAAFGAHANLYGEQARKARAEADALAQRSQYQKPEFASTVASALAGLSEGQGNELSQYQQRGNWGMNPGRELPADQSGPPMPDMPKSAPNWYKPEVERRFNQGRAAHLAQLGATGDTNGEQVIKAFANLLGQGRIDKAIADPRQAQVLGSAMAASEGKPLFHQGNNGTMNLFSGAENINEVGKSAAMENRAQAGNAASSAALHRAQIPEVQSRIDLNRSKIGQQTINPDGSITAPTAPPKPMPAPALKMQQEGLESLSIASNINPMLQRFVDDIDSNRLKIGPVANLMNKGKNFAGASDTSSRNFASFQATLEKLRNDSLRLNKGVQTDGDAQRAWNELMNNINDPEVVKQRIGEIQNINEKAVELHRMNINQVRRNYNHPDIDVSGYVSKGSAKPSDAPKQYTRTGMLNGRKVGVLPSGETVYQDTGEAVK